MPSNLLITKDENHFWLERHLYIENKEMLFLIPKSTRSNPKTLKSIFFNFSSQNFSKIGVMIAFYPKFHLALVSLTVHFFRLRSSSIGLCPCTIFILHLFDKRYLIEVLSQGDLKLGSIVLEMERWWQAEEYVQRFRDAIWNHQITRRFCKIVLIHSGNAHTLF